MWTSFHDHVRRSWTTLAGAPPGLEATRRLCRLLHVEVLSLDHRQPPTVARDLLRMAVDSRRADDAWSVLAGLATEMSADAVGFDRPAVVQRLRSRAITLVGRQDYVQDREVLKAVSVRSLEDLERFTRIDVPGEGPLRIDRAVVAEALAFAKKGNSFLITGEAGAGKSAVLHDLAVGLRSPGTEVVVLSADTAPEELRRLQHDPSDVLRDWAQSSNGWLLVDALDALREPQAGAALRHILARVLGSPPSWGVIATCRVFDLKHSKELRELFRGRPLEGFCSSQFRQLRHVHVPLLDKAELEQAQRGSPKLGEKLAAAPADLVELLRIPFHLWLLARLCDVLPADGLSKIRGRASLLEEYWSYRVAGDHLRNEREALLRVVCEDMVDHHRLYSARATASLRAPQILTVLESDEVLVPRRGGDDTWLKFPHHALFDYAVMKLVLRPQVGSFRGWLGEDRTRAISIRPSFVLELEDAWHQAEHDHRDERSQFWDEAFELLAPGIPSIVSLVPAEVAARNAEEARDLSVLLSRLVSPISDTRAAASDALDAVRAALAALGRSAARGPWPAFLKTCAAQVSRETLGQLDMMLWQAFQAISGEDESVREAIHAAGCDALDFALRERIPHGGLLHKAIRVVCGTLPKRPLFAERVLRKLLEPERLAEYGHLYVSEIGQEAPKLLAVMPDFVESLYTGLFTVEPADDGPVQMSRLPAIVSNIRQDYHMGRWALGEVARDFAQSLPDRATRAVAKVVDHYARSQHARDAELVPEHFEFEGSSVTFCSDFSYIWDSGTYDHDDAMKVLDGWESGLADVLADSTRENDWQQAVSTFLETNRMAIGWSRMLRLAANHPTTLGLRLRQLALQPVLLLNLNTAYSAGLFLRARHAKGDAEERRAIEEVVLSLPEFVDTAVREHVNRHRDTLICDCMDYENIVLPRTRDRRETAEQSDPDHSLRPVFTTTGFVAVAEDWERDLGESGVDTGDTQSRILIALTKPVRDFQTRHSSQGPDGAALAEGAEAVRRLWAEIRGHPLERHTTLLGTAQGYLAEAGAICAASEHLQQVDGLHDLAASILVAMAGHPDPAYSSERESQFAQSPSWGMPNPRISAAVGLLSLTRYEAASQQLLDTVEALSKDDVAPVRFQIVQRANTLYDRDRALMWRIIDAAMREEVNPAVVQGALNGPISRLLHHHREECLGLLIDAWRRSPELGRSELQGQLARALADTWLFWGESRSRSELTPVLANPLAFQSSVRALVRACGCAIAAASATRENRERAAAGLREAAAAVCACAKNQPWRSHVALEADDPRLAEMKNTAALLDAVAFEIRMVSKGGAKSPALSPEHRAWFIDAITPVVDDLLVLPLVPIAHHLVEGIVALTEASPRNAFLLMSRVVAAATEDRYHIEQLAMAEVVAMVETVLADHGSIFEEPQCRTALMDILDQFAGWPAAQRLLHRIDDLYR
ncbi:MAG: ATP-binding protein [Myxococcota bacterium]